MTKPWRSGGARSIVARALCALFAIGALGCAATTAGEPGSTKAPHGRFEYENNAFDATYVRLYCGQAIVFTERGLTIGKSDSRIIRHACHTYNSIEVRYLGGGIWRSEPFTFTGGTLRLVIAHKSNWNWYTVRIKQ